METKNKKKTFRFNCAWAEILENYPAHIRLEVYEAVIRYASSGDVPSLGRLASMAFAFIRQEMDAETAVETETEEQQSEPDPTPQPEEEPGQGSTWRIPYQAIQASWNTICGSVGLPQVSTLSKQRKEKIRVRIADFPVHPGQCLGHIEKIFQAIAENPFLKGDNHSGWQATFDWVFANDKNWLKVLEGNYKNHTRYGINQKIGGFAADRIERIPLGKFIPPAAIVPAGRCVSVL